MTLHEKMLLIRALEEKLQELCDVGEAGDLHFNRGQESIAVGACAALRETDYVVTHHRTIAHAVAKGVPLQPLVAELLGKSSGLNMGMAGEMHLSAPEQRFMFTFQLVGTCIPVAAGLAWAVKNYKKTDDIVTVFHGDAATANGQWHEGMNLAAVQQVPLLVICENNGLAGNIKSSHYQPVQTLTQRVRGYGIDGFRIDGNCIEDVFEEVQRSAEYVRENCRPFFLECLTTRLCKHKQGQGDIRTADELAQLAERDPLKDMDLSWAREQVRPIIEAVRAAEVH
ncbi:MAG: thiamine pyrophosphate-dependent dehydrogenase E1 component subunit alpha [Dehalococcoidia bacterium]